jgi:hypothetical protein
MTEHSTCGQGGSHPPTVGSQCRVTDREHTAIHHSEHPTRETPINSVGADAGFDQLAPADDAVLAVRQCSNLGVTEVRGDFAARGAAN